MTEPDAETLFDHVAVAVPDPAALTPLVVGELGGRPYAAGPGRGFGWWQWEFAGGGVLEVLEPEGPPDGFLHRFLATRGAGVHHVTFKVSDHRATLERAAALGYQVVGVSQDSPGWKEAFLHPKQAQGIVVQIVETPPQADADYESDRPFPPAPDAASPRSTLVGLRLVAHSASAARRQWQTLLGGHCSAAADGRELVFRWPESPLRVALTLDADAEEGPRGLEFAGCSPGLSEGPHPLLGTAIIALSDPAL